MNTTYLEPTSLDASYGKGTRGILIDATDMFGSTSHVSEEIAVIEAKEHSITVNIPVLVNKGEKVSLKITRENVGITTTVYSNRIKPIHKEHDTVPKEELTKVEEKVEELNSTIRILTGIIEEKVKEAEGKMQKFQSDFNYLKYYSYVWIFCALLLGFFFTAGISGLLGPFSSIVGCLLTSVGILAGILDWKDRVKKTDA